MADEGQITTSRERSSEPQREARRERLGLRVIAILNQFWRDYDTPGAVQTLELEGWLDVLEPLSDTEIRAAWAEYQRSGPRTAKGTLCKPDAGAIYNIVMRSRARSQIITSRQGKEAPAAPVQSLSHDQALRILREVNFEPKLTDEAKKAKQA